MSGIISDHQEREADPRLKSNQNVQDRSPVHQQPSPSAAAQRALARSGILTAKRVLALQRTVGNRAVQRVVAARAGPGLVQRHMSDEDSGAANAAIGMLTDSVLDLRQLSAGAKKASENLGQANRNWSNSTLGARSYPCRTGFSREEGEATEGYHQVEGEIPTGAEEETPAPIPASGGV